MVVAHRLLLMLLLLASGLTACVSGVQRDPSDPIVPWRYAGQRFSVLAIEMSDAARGRLKDDAEPESQRLAQTIERALRDRGLIDRASDYRVRIELTELRVRSTFWAFMLSFVSGSDRIAGQVTIEALVGRRLDRFTVSAANAFAGWITPPAHTRAQWLYDEFAHLTVESILGGPATVAALGE